MDDQNVSECHLPLHPLCVSQHVWLWAGLYDVIREHLAHLESTNAGVTIHN